MRKYQMKNLPHHFKMVINRLFMIVKKLMPFTLGFVGTSFFIFSVHAAPQGGIVVKGQGEISQSSAASTLINQNSQMMAINWDSFNISQNESVTFNQPNASSVALNRIINSSPSSIMGQINSNGHVVLSNPSGILFGANAQVHVGGLLATGLDIDPAAFMSGQFELLNDRGAGFVINRGLLNAATGGDIHLVGSRVSNEGVIIADYGQINLLAGERAIVDFTGDGLLNFQITESVKQNLTQKESAVENTGTLQADGGKIVLDANVAQDIFTQAVNNTGIIRATKIENIGGVVRLSGTGGHVRNSGEISATNGGDVVLTSTDNTEMTGNGSVDVSNKTGIAGFFYMLGQKVGLFDSATINATGKNGGGQVRIGGDIAGGEKLASADYTIMASGAAIDASATENGDGGSVVLWANKTAQIHGDLKARGGSQSGNGGFIETSGKEFLAVTSTPNAGANFGDSGEWWLDPTDVSIEATPALPLSDDGKNLLTGAPNYTPDNKLTSIIYADKLITTLNDNNTSVTITTDSAFQGAAEGDITITVPIVVNPDKNQGLSSSLKLTADKNIVFLNGSQIVAQGTTTITNAGAVNTGLTVGDIVNNSLNIELNALNGNILLDGTSATVAIDTNGGDFTAATKNLDVTKEIKTGGGNFTVSASENFTMASNYATNGGDFSVTAGAAFTLPASITTAGGVISLDAPLVVNGNTLLDSSIVSGGGVISLNQNVTQTNASDTLNLNAGTSTISVNSVDVSELVFVSASNISLSGDINTSSAMTFISPVDIDGDASVDTSAGLAGSSDIAFNDTINGTTTGLDSLTLTAGANDITFTGSVGGTTRLNNINIVSAKKVTAAAMTANTLAVNNTDLLTFNDTVSLNGLLNQSGTGAVNLNADVSANGDITFTGATTVKQSLLIDSGGAGNIIFSETVNPDAADTLDLTLTAGTGDVTFAEDIGGLFSFNTVAINSASNINAKAITANRINSTATLNSDFTALTASAGNIDLTGATFNLTGAVTSTGNVVINNSGKLRVGSNAQITSLGSFSQIGSGDTALASNIESSGSEILFAGAVNFIGDRQLVNKAGGDIKLVQAVSGSGILGLKTDGDIYLDDVDAKALQLNKYLLGDIDLHLSGDLLLDVELSFSDIDNVILENNALISIAKNAVTPSSITFGSNNQLYGDKSLTLIANEVILGKVGDISNQADLIGLTVNSDSLTLLDGISIAGEIDFSETTITKITAPIEAYGNNASIILGGVVGETSLLDIMNNGVTQLTRDITVRDVNFRGATGGVILNNDTTSSIAISTALKDGDIDFSSTAITGLDEGLTLAAGNGRIYLDDVGSSTESLNELIIESASSLNLSGEIYTQETLDFRHAGNINLNANPNTNTNGVSLVSRTGDVVLQNTVSGNTNLTVTSDEGSVALNQISGVDSFVVSAKNAVNISGDITASSVDMQNVTGDINILQPLTVMATGSNASIQMQNANIISDVALTLNANDGDIKLGSVGNALIAVNDLIISQSAELELYGDVFVKNGLDLSNVGHVSLKNDVEINTTQSSSVLASAFTMGDTKIDGSHDLLINAGEGLIQLVSVGDNEAVNNLRLNTIGEVKIAGNYTVINDFSINSSNANNPNNITLIDDTNIALQNGNLDFSHSTIDGEKQLVIDAALGKVNLNNVGQTTALTNLTIARSENIDLNFVTTKFGQSYAGDINLSGDLNVTGIGAIIIEHDLNLKADTNLKAIGDINVSGDINGAFNVLIDATDDVVLDGDVGRNVNINQLTVKSRNITTQSLLTLNDLSLNANESVIQNGNIKVAAGNVFVRAQTGAITMKDDTFTIASDVATIEYEANQKIQLANIKGGQVALVSHVGGGSVQSITAINDVSFNVAENITQLGPVDSALGNVTLTAVNGFAEIKNINAGREVVIKANTTVTQNGEVNSTSGNVAITSDTADIVMLEGASINAADQNITLLANNDLRITKLSAGLVALEAKNGVIEGQIIDTDVKHISATTVSLVAANGIAGKNATPLSVKTSNLSLNNSKNDVLLATQSLLESASRPENEIMEINQISVDQGNFTLSHKGALKFNEEVTVGSKLNVVSSSQVTIDKNIVVTDDVTFTVGEDTVDSSADGLILKGDMQSIKGNIDLVVNDAVQLLGDVKAKNGDINVSSESNAIALTSLVAKNKVTVSADSQIKALTSSKPNAQNDPNIEADNVELVTRNSTVGAFSKPIDITAKQTTINANQNVFITGAFGTVFSGGGYIDPGVAVSSANKGQSTSAQEFSFVDATVFSRKLNLFGIVRDGLKLPEDQLEDE